MSPLLTFEERPIADVQSVTVTDDAMATDQSTTKVAHVLTDEFGHTLFVTTVRKLQ